MRIASNLVGAAALAACQGSGENQAGNNGAANAAAPSASNTAANNSAANKQVSAWDGKGPVAKPEDASLPADCRTVVTETQACIDKLAGTPQGPFREGTMRAKLSS